MSGPDGAEGHADPLDLTDGEILACAVEGCPICRHSEYFGEVAA